MTDASLLATRARPLWQVHGATANDSGLVQSLVRNAPLILLSVVGTLLMLEVALRAVGLEPTKHERQSPPQGMHVDDIELGHVLGASVSVNFVRADFEIQVTTNALGMRDGAVGPRDGAFRILSIGDSYAFGYGVEQDESYAHQLEQLLNAGGKEQRFEVMNGGVSGYSTFQEAALLERLAPRVEPDLVLVGFFTGNDFKENLERAGRYERQFEGGVVEHVRLAALAAPILKNVEYKLRTAESIDVSIQAMEELSALCERLGAPLVVLLITPTPDQYDAYYGKGHLRLWLDRALGLDPWERHDEFLARTQALGIPVVDTLTVFRAVEPNDNLGLPVSGHWTPRGHHIAAEALRDLLREQRLIPG